MDRDEWLLVSGAHEGDNELTPQVPRAPPFKFFQFELRLGKTSRPLPDRLLPKEVTRAKLGTPSPVADQQQSFLFTLLPLEIRLQIYDFVLRPLNNTLLRPLDTTTDSRVRMTRTPVHPRLPTVLSILLTCRRALYEAEHIFYTSNRLWLNDIAFPQSLGPVRRSAVWEVAIPAESAARVLELLKGFQVLPNLRSVHLVRQLSIRFIDISSWNILASQLVIGLEKLDQLEELSITTFEATDLSLDEMERKERLESIDGRLRQAVHRT